MDDVPVVPAQMPCRHHIVRDRNYTEYQADYPKRFSRRKFPETMLARRWLYPCHSEPFLALYLYALKNTGLWIPAQPPLPDDIGAKWGGRVIHPCFLSNHVTSKRHLRSFLVSNSETKHLPPTRCWLQAPNFTPSMLDLSLIDAAWNHKSPRPMLVDLFLSAVQWHTTFASVQMNGELSCCPVNCYGCLSFSKNVTRWFCNPGNTVLFRFHHSDVRAVSVLW